LTFVKKSFDGFKVKALADDTPERRVRYNNNKRTSRRQQRQKHTCEKRLIAGKLYTEQTGLKVDEVLHPDFVSDYASGPETEGEETQEEWKIRMGHHLRMTRDGMGATAWKRTMFLERKNPGWRSEKVSSNRRNSALCSPIPQMNKLMRDLQKIADENATPGERQRQDSSGRFTYYRVENTGRSAEKPPPRAPHNFGISKQWYQENHQNPRFKVLLADWGNWAGPDGWDSDDGETSATEEDEETEEEQDE
jgi:hypothetical protein